MKYPEGWSLEARPSDQFPDMHVLVQRDRGPVAAITPREDQERPGVTFWEYEPLKGAGATAAGGGARTLESAARLAMRDYWTPVAEQPDTSDLDDEDYDYARWGATVSPAWQPR